MIRLILGRTARLSASVVIAAVVIGAAGFAVLDPTVATGVFAGSSVSTQPNKWQGRQEVGWQWRSVPDRAGIAAAGPSTAQEEPELHAGRRAPHLAGFEPSGPEVPVSAAVVMYFTEPMARAATERSLVIRPRVDGELAWLDDFTLRFDPYGLTHGTTYEVNVHGRSVLGVPLAGQGSWSFTTTAGAPLVLAPGPSVIRVPILMYHYIRVSTDVHDRLGFALSVTPPNFAAQMDWLAANGYHTITTRDLYAYLTGARGLPSRPVILTFDDGYADFFTTAMPILRSHGFKAVSYVVSGFIGWPGYMGAAQIAAADRAGIEIGSHTVSHPNLARQSYAGMRYQVSASKHALEQLLGHPVVSFCYPSGAFNSAVVAAVQDAGYEDATTTGYGSSHSLYNRYLWGRVRVSGGEGLTAFASAVLGAS